MHIVHGIVQMTCMHVVDGVVQMSHMHVINACYVAHMSCMYV